MPTKYVSGDRNEILVPVDSATAIRAGDLLWLSTDDARPFSMLSDAGSKAANQEQAHDVFLGVARDSSQAGQVEPIRVATTGVFEFDCVNTTYEIGNVVGADGTGAAGADGVSNTQVAAVASPNLSIGRVAKRGTAIARVRVSIVSTVLYGGPQTSQ